MESLITQRYECRMHITIWTYDHYTIYDLYVKSNFNLISYKLYMFLRWTYQKTSYAEISHLNKKKKSELTSLIHDSNELTIS